MAMRKYSDGPAASTSRGDVESLLGAEYEVFLNFRGPDTRLTLADCLYHSLDVAGIRVFRDEEEIRKGEAIGGELERAIKSCTICIPIFSVNYASSAWCLRELAYMVGCKAIILPVFFGVDPNDVKLKTGLYQDALQKHEEKFGCEVVQQWKGALTEVARIKGWDLKNRGQGELIRLIVDEVLSKLNKREKNLPRHLLGIQDRVKDVMCLLDEGSPEVRYIVIHGMGGIGKTTLAKVVFNQISSQFHGCSFLSDVREASKGGKVIQLQKQLLSEILNFKSVEIFDADAGINQIKRRFRDKKVLIVLDDLDKWDQLSKLAESRDWFGQGSRIIITTRDTNFLRIKEENRENNVYMRAGEFKIYQMIELCHQHALQLFSKHAFEMDSPSHDYDNISRNIINKAGGLPLALEVIGSSLYCKSEKIWKDMLKKLDSVPNQDVLQKLNISIDMLDDAQREIFLDIACYFIGEERIHPHYMWKALGFFPKVQIDCLNRMSLIKIVGDKLLMHDVLRDLGREIIRQEDKVPEKRSRLWRPKIALNILQTRKGTGNIIALKLTGLSTEHDFTSEAFSRLPSLRLLELEGGNLVGDFKNLLTSLRWLFWHRCPPNLQAVNLWLWNLVVLKLSHSDIPENWNGWGPCLVNPDLKVIHLMECNLSTTPDFSTCLNLRILVSYEHSPRWLQIDSSINKLEHLKRLEIIPTLDNSPMSKSLHLDRFAVPSGIWCLKHLTGIKLFDQYIREVPASIGELTSLTCLSLECCDPLGVLPDSIGKLRSLVTLNLSSTDIKELPYSIGDLKRLEEMNLQFSRIRALPKSIGGLESLLDLNLLETKIRELPDSIGDLKRLKKMYLGFTLIRELPNSIGGLESLLELSLLGTKVTKLPDSFGSLHRLEYLALPKRKVREQWKAIRMLKNLEELNYGKLFGCIWLGSTPKKEGIFDRDTTWPPQLCSLNISCDDPRSLPRLPFVLRRLELRDVKSPIEPSFFSNLRYLSELTLSACCFREIEFGRMENLVRLAVEDCKSLLSVSGIRSLGNLKELNVWSCPQLIEIQELGELESLEVLSIGKCIFTELLPDLSKLRKLRHVSLPHMRS